MAKKELDHLIYSPNASTPRLPTPLAPAPFTVLTRLCKLHGSFGLVYTPLIIQQYPFLTWKQTGAYYPSNAGHQIIPIDQGDYSSWIIPPSPFHILSISVRNNVFRTFSSVSRKTPTSFPQDNSRFIQVQLTFSTATSIDWSAHVLDARWTLISWDIPPTSPRPSIPQLQSFLRWLAGLEFSSTSTSIFFPISSTYPCLTGIVRH